MSAFDRFQVRLGNRTIYESKRKNRYVLFDDEGFESTDLSEGYNSILLDGDMDINPKELITYRGNGFVQMCVQNGDVLHIGDDILLVDDPDRPENMIGIDAIRDVAIGLDETKYPVVSEGRIPLNISVPDDSAIIIRILGLKSKVKTILAGSDLRNYYRGKTKCQFEIQLSEYCSEPDLLTVDVRENDARSVCKSTFAYLPGFHPKFDKEFYLDEVQGLLQVSDTESIQFTTNQDEVQIPFKLQNSDANLSISVPSIWLSFDGDSWIPPGIHSYSIMEFRWDRLFLKTRVSKNIRLYTNVPRIELEPEMTSEFTSFNLIGLRDEIENHVSELQSKYEISLSLNSQIKRRFIEIRVHNQYTFTEDDCSIIFEDLTRIPARYVLKRNGATIEEKQLVPGFNKLSIDNRVGVTLSILEQNPYTKCFDVEMYSKILGGEEYVIKEESGFIFVYRNDKMQFSSSPDDFDAVMKEYESKMRFNSWMKKPEVKRSLLNLVNPPQVTFKSKKTCRRF